MERLTGYLVSAWYFGIAYLAFACMVFQIRHPKATEIQRLLHIKEAVCFDTVPELQ
jgi:hypothetical protein